MESIDEGKGELRKKSALHVAGSGSGEAKRVRHSVPSPSESTQSSEGESAADPIVRMRTGRARGRAAGAGHERGRRFTLNPLIFAKQQQEMRRRSLSALRLSYYSADMDGVCNCPTLLLLCMNDSSLENLKMIATFSGRLFFIQNK